MPTLVKIDLIEAMLECALDKSPLHGESIVFWLFRFKLFSLRAAIRRIGVE